MFTDTPLIHVMVLNVVHAFIDGTMCNGYFLRTGTNLRTFQILMLRSLKTGMRTWMVNGSLPWSPTQSTRYRLLLHCLEFYWFPCFIWLGYYTANYSLFSLWSDHVIAEHLSSMFMCITEPQFWESLLQNQKAQGVELDLFHLLL